MLPGPRAQRARVLVRGRGRPGGRHSLVLGDAVQQHQPGARRVAARGGRAVTNTFSLQLNLNPVSGSYKTLKALGFYNTQKALI